MENKNLPEPRRALGRGLSALLNTGSAPKPAQSPGPTSLIESVKIAKDPEVESRFFSLSLDKIEANPQQPRKFFNEERLQELAISLREQGLVQPIVVRKIAGGLFQIVAGERRWRAAKIAGLAEVPVIVREDDRSETQNDLASLVENIQREELNPIELAQAYERLFKIHQFTQEALAEKLGVSRVKVANTLRLLKLPQNVQALVASGQISEGHSRALLSLEKDAQISEMADKILKEHLSVRDVESQIRVTVVGRGVPVTGGLGTPSPGSGPSSQKNPELLALEDELRQVFGTKVVVRGNSQRGILEIYYSGADSFHRVLHQLRSTSK